MNRMRFRSTVHRAAALCATAALMTPALTASALAAPSRTLGAASTMEQSIASRAIDPRWDAWVGCWQAERMPVSLQSETTSELGDLALPPEAPGATIPGAPIVCVIPTSDASTVQVTTVAGDKIVARDSIAVTGEKRARARQGCTGWESATWSSDGTRVYLRSEDACPRGLARTSTGVLAMSPANEWVDVQGVTVGGHTGVRTVRYRSVAIPAALSADLAATLSAQLRDRNAAIGAARAAAGVPLTNAAIVDASRHLDPSVAEAWVLASGQHVNVDARELVALADAGVPGNVTDALVALSNPQKFALGDATARGDAIALQDHRAPAGAYAGIVSGRELPVFIDPYAFSPYGFDAYGYSPYYGYRPYYGYGALPYSGYPYGLGYVNPYGGWIAPPVIVLKGSQSGTSVAGRAVKGRGYEPASSVTGTRTAEPRTTSAPPSNSGQNSPPPSSPPQRTAHERP